MNELINVLGTMRRDIESQYRGRLRGLSQRYDVDDLFQDISANVVSRGHQCRGQTFDEQRRFLRVVIKNTYLSALVTHTAGKRSVRRETSSEALGAVHATVQSPHEMLCLKEMCGEAAKLLRGLPPRQAAAVQMWVVEGRAYAEIAAHLGTTMQAVRSLVSRGLARARAASCEAA